MDEFSNQDLSHRRVASPHPSPDVIEWPLRSGWSRALFFTVIAAASALMIYKTTRVALATIPEDSLTIAEVQKGLEYDPGNPNLLHRLGVVYSFIPTEMNLTEALKYMRQAVADDPQRWDFWTDLATTCDFAGDTLCADMAFDRAQAFNPRLPRLQWMIANHYVLTNRLDQSFPHFRRLLETSPDDYWGPTFRLCLRATSDPNEVFAQVVPQGKDATMRFTYLTFLETMGDYESAMRIWGRMITGTDRTPDIAAVKQFLDFLLDHNRIQEASTVWHDLEQAGLVRREGNGESGNLIFNGSFARQPLNTGFDWLYDASPGSEVLYDFADPSASPGKNCLRIEFLVGRNAGYDLLRQVVLVQPNSRYQLTAQVRSEGITSDSGPRFLVSDLGCPNCGAFSTEATLGTTPWHTVDVTFTTQPQTQAVRIDFSRPPGQMPPREISGTIWVSEVKLQTSGNYGLGIVQGGPR
jgi:hypothetical protein